MSDAQPSHPARAARTPGQRAADHAAIDRLADDLLPALIAKLGATDLGELEVREDDWRVRLRRPAGHTPPAPRDRKRDRTERSDRSERSDRPERADPAGDRPSRSTSRSVATSPAVGIYRPRPDLAAGTRVRAGDALGAVDMLGAAHEVTVPVDGIVGASLAESGDAVEYGQELVVIEFAPGATHVP